MPAKKILFACTLLQGVAKDAFNMGVSNTRPSGNTWSSMATNNQKWEVGLVAVQSCKFNNNQNAWRRQWNYSMHMLMPQCPQDC